MKKREEEANSATREREREREKDNEGICQRRAKAHNRIDKWVTSRLEVQTARESMLEKDSRGHARCCGGKIAIEFPATQLKTESLHPN